MHPAKLKQLEARLYSQMPLTGGCLRQRAAQALAQDGSPDAVRILAKAIARSDDRQVLAIALDALRRIRKQQCIDEVCAVWAVTRHKDLANLLIKKSWVASTPVEIKVLSALKAGQLEVVTKGGAEIVEPLLKAFSDADSEIASRASQCAIALTNPDAIDYLCERWLKTRDRLLEQLILQGKYVAQKPIEARVLSALKVEQLETLKQGKAEVVPLLLQACQDTDRTITKNAQIVLRELKNPEAQELLCRLVIDQDHQLAREVALEWQYAPRDLNQRVLFYFLTEQWEKYESLDYEHTILQTLYELGDEQFRKRIAQKARQAGRVEWTQIVAGGRQGKRLGEMTDAEWQTTLAVLSEGKHWEGMWQLAQSAQPIWSVRLLRQLKDAGWVPKTEFAELVQAGQKCLAEVLLNSSWLYQATLRGHRDGVLCLAISPDSKLLASGSPEKRAVQGDSLYKPYKTIKLWSLPDGKRLNILEKYNKYEWDYYYGYSDYELCLAISPDGKLLASGSNDKTVRLWSLPYGTEIQTLTGHSKWINCLAISPDSKLLASGSDDGTIRLWSLPDGTLLQTLTGRSGSVRSLAISPDGKLLASGSDDGTVRLWSLPDGTLLQTLTGHSSYVVCLGISPDGKLLASGSYDGTVRLWSLPDGKPLQTLTGHSGSVRSLALSPDGKLLASSSSKEETVRLWSLPDGKPLQTLTGHSGSVRSLALSPDGKLLASGSYDGTVRLWTSNLYYLSRLPIEQMSMEDMQWVQEALQNKNISEAEQNWLEFIQALVSWRRRFDVEVEEAPQRIDAGEFDIEIEG